MTGPAERLSTPARADEPFDRLLGGDPAFVADPYPAYAHLREADPVHWSARLNAWVVTRYAHVVSGLRDPRLSAKRMPALLGNVEADDAQRAVMLGRAMTQMINSDPPEHARRRELVGAAFHPRRIESYRRRVAEVAAALLDQVVDRGRMDVIADFAFPLPMTVIAEIVGIPQADGARVKAWADDVAGFLASARVDHRQTSAYLRSWGEIAAYFRALLARRGGGEDVVAQLAERIRAGETNEEEALSNLVLLAVAGHETTTNTIGLALLSLLRQPDQLARLRDGPALIDTAVEELLRFEPTSQWDFRIATEDLEIGGTRIEAGRLIDFVLASANRDPAHFAEPDRLDLGRSPNRHVTFGQGPHFCLGSQLARLELQVALGALVSRLDSIALEDEPDWKPNVRMRGLRSLRVRFAAAAD